MLAPEDAARGGRFGIEAGPADDLGRRLERERLEPAPARAREEDDRERRSRRASGV